ncbi:MAG: TetR/AcrR family transcriptional regulator [Methylophilaceae bacterium]|jgi:AcrR family transcriptional regulator|nr:TetR/AcrR family transcriptional regulator [Methylophilaceae bacterium]
MATVGRPRSFDKEEALKKAMHVFWEKGYEGTSMADLIESIGMKAPSLYAAFGNKDAIFKEVVQKYLPIVVNGQLATLNNTSDIVEAVENTLKECVRLFTSPDNPHTCLIMTAAINASPEHQDHVVSLRAMREDYRNAWVQRFERAEQERQLTGQLSPQQLADFYVTLIQGMSLRAKDGANKQDLTRTAEIALQILK